jgi:hypothetical protein
MKSQISVLETIASELPLRLHRPSRRYGLDVRKLLYRHEFVVSYYSYSYSQLLSGELVLSSPLCLQPRNVRRSLSRTYH